MRMSKGPVVLSQVSVTGAHYAGGGHRHGEKVRTRAVYRNVASKAWKKLGVYLSEFRRLNGKPRADDGTEEEGKECRGKEWGKHAIFYYTRQKEGGREGGGEGKRENAQEAQKINK